jgi:type I restriction enzyme R subunit
LEEAGEAQEHTSEEIIRNATEQALKILKDMNVDRESFRKIGLTFEEKAFYDILMALRDEYNFEYGTDKIVDGVSVNDKCKALAKKIKEIIDTKSSFADWLNNQIVRDQLKFDIKVCLIKNGYPPQYSPEVFRKVMEQVENFEENSWDAMDSRDPTPAIRESIFRYNTNTALLGMVAEEPVKYGTRKQPKEKTDYTGET